MFAWDHNVCSSALEMERAWAATHNAVAETRAATAGDTTTRKLLQEASEMEFSMSGQLPLSEGCHLRC